MAIQSKMMSAAQAYSQAARGQAAKAAGAEDKISYSETHPVKDFSDVLRDSVQSAIDTQKNAEQMSMKAVANEADLAEVINAVANAELTLQSVVSVRDKVVSAYQSIIRMPI